MPTNKASQEPSVEKSFCTTREAAGLLGVSIGTVQLWVENGTLQAWKTTGGHRRVLRDSVERLLHRKPSQSTEPAPSVTRVNVARCLRVLVVDDDVNLLRLYEANISKWPMAHEVTTINDAVSALVSIGRICPDLLIVDLHMPGMDGFNMLRMLRTIPEVTDTTIVVVSGLDAAEIQQRGGLPPEVQVLPKPVPFKRLLAIATGIIGQSRFLSQSA